MASTLRAVINDISPSTDGQNLNVQVQLLDENDTEVKLFVLTQGPDNVSRESILKAILNNTRQHLDEEKRKASISDTVLAVVDPIKADLEQAAFDLTGIGEVQLGETEHIEDVFKPVIIEKKNPATGELAKVEDGSLVVNADGTVVFKN